MEFWSLTKIRICYIFIEVKKWSFLSWFGLHFRELEYSILQSRNTLEFSTIAQSHTQICFPLLKVLQLIIFFGKVNKSGYLISAMIPLENYAQYVLICYVILNLTVGQNEQLIEISNKSTLKKAQFRYGSSIFFLNLDRGRFHTNIS